MGYLPAVGRVSIQPDKLVVGRLASWTIRYEAGRTILSGGSIYIRPYGNPLVRPAGQTYMPASPNYVSLRCQSRANIELSCTPWLVVTVTVKDGRIERGDNLEIVYGDMDAGCPGVQLRAIAFKLRFRVSVEFREADDPVALPERPALHLIPDEPAKYLLYAPSILAGEQDIDLLLRCVDRFGNTVKRAGSGLYLSQVKGLAVGKSISLDAGPAALAQVRCHRESTIPARRIRLELRDPQHHTLALSNPIEVAAGPEEDRLYWGDLHCHSDLEQGLDTPQFLYEYARDEEKLDFLAHMEHQWGSRTRWTGRQAKTWRGGHSVPEYNRDTWELRKELVRKHYEPSRFVTLLGLEWASNVYGHVNVFYPGEDGPLLVPSSSWSRGEAPPVVWEALDGREALIMPHHPSAPVGAGKPPEYWATSGFDWRYYHAGLMPCVEMYSKWGSSEYLGCPRPLLNQQAEGCVQTALGRGYRLGFVAGSDSHASRAGSDLYQDHTYRQSGLTAVFAPELTRESIYRALAARRCYATTGQRIILRFFLNGCGMGEVVELENREQEKQLHLEVAVPGAIDRVEVVKNGSLFYLYSGHLAPDLGWWRDNGWEMEVRLVDRETTGALFGLAGEGARIEPGTGGLESGRGRHTAFDYYYVRVTQQDGEMAWSSPIWVTVGPGWKEPRR